MDAARLPERDNLPSMPMESPLVAVTVAISGQRVSSAGAWYPLAKRALDIVVALLLLVVLLPLLAAVAVLIRLTSPGPALFRQRRIGEGGRPFIMYKFRTMVADADPAIHMDAIRRYSIGLALAEDSHDTPYKLVDDPRVTRLGAWLRKTSIDELPQLFNVIRGEMSLVGPRPALPYEFQLYAPHGLLRFKVPQGMTGLWQVRGRSTVSCEEAIALDVEYARRRSLALDCKILLLTIPAVIFMRGGA